MWLISAAALLAAGFAVSAAMATAILERRGEIGLMRSLGAGKAAVAALFYAESSLLALAAGTLGYLAGSLLASRSAPTSSPADGPPRSSTPSSSPSSSRSPSSSPSPAAPPPSAPPSRRSTSTLRATD